MSSKAKLIPLFAILAIILAVAPAAQADPIQIITESDGFRVFGLGNSGIGIGHHDQFDILIGDANSETNFIDSNGGSFITSLNPLMFLQGFTGLESGGVHQVTFSQLLTINGQTQTLNILASLAIGENDVISILGSEPLVFEFDTFSVTASVLPVTLFGQADAVYDSLCARIEVVPNTCEPVPEPATMVLLGTGLAGIAAGLRHRRRRNAT